MSNVFGRFKYIIIKLVLGRYVLQPQYYRDVKIKDPHSGVRPPPLESWLAHLFPPCRLNTVRASAGQVVLRLRRANEYRTWYMATVHGQ